MQSEVQASEMHAAGTSHLCLKGIPACLNYNASTTSSAGHKSHIIVNQTKFTAKKTILLLSIMQVT